MRKSNLLFAASILFLIKTTAFAQDELKAVTDTIAIDEVVVTGTKTSVNRNQVPLTISVITGDKIAKSFESSLLPVLSEQVPGLFVTERGVTGFGVANGAAGQISIRGVGGSPTTQVLVLLNGNPQYMGIMGHPLADAYRSSNIERVEIIRGPASMLYGSNAMGGVINIITKEQTSEGASANAVLQYGSYNTLKVATGGGFNKKGFAIYAGLNHDQTDGHREASYFNSTDGYLKAGYKINDNFTVSADMSLVNFRGADPGLDTSDIVKHRDTLDIFRGMGAIAFNNRFEKIDGSARVFYNFGTHDITGFLSNDFNYGLMVYENFHYMKGNTITLGVDYKTFGGKAEDIRKDMLLVDNSINEIAAYTMVQQQLFKNLIINGGIRIENNSVYGNELIPSGGISYNPWNSTTIKTSVSKGFRSPTLNELYIQFQYPNAPSPNPELKPEKSINAELSVQQKLFENKLGLELGIFYIKGSDFIAVGFNEANKKTYLNIGEVHNSGLELAINHAVTNWLSWNANYSYINMENPVLGTPTQKLFTGISYHPKKLNVTLSYQYIDDIYTLVGKTELKESYTLLNAQASYRVHKTLQLFIKGENLLNEQYTINYGYTMPGTTVMAGFSFNYSTN
ncbi:MAG: TonB-dependent receptor [Salinivirgaceae bacterium]